MARATRHPRRSRRTVEDATALMLRTARAMIGSSQAQPLPLALVLLNVLFLAGFMLMLREISASAQRRDQVMMSLVEKCASR
ncbi:hypothetical protein WN72_23130 [Bradyrhizobium arachidis]|uniref:Uncharacterized protein n=2 Tax=Bradyrhizobium arachidis TaxID=858423 RepID=A0AAE7NPU7_9BRAD|nr:hypothetical protein WN72_23130 [Bradyrhizobium arachidis]